MRSEDQRGHQGTRKGGKSLRLSTRNSTEPDAPPPLAVLLDVTADRPGPVDPEAPLFPGTTWTLQRVATLLRPFMELPSKPGESASVSPLVFVEFLVELMRDRPADERPTRDTVDRLIAVAYLCLNNLVDSKRKALRRRRPDALSRQPDAFQKAIAAVTQGQDFTQRGAMTRAAEELSRHYFPGRKPDYLRQLIRQHRPR
jgi:hypothetical protein